MKSNINSHFTQLGHNFQQSHFQSISALLGCDVCVFVAQLIDFDVLEKCGLLPRAQSILLPPDIDMGG